MSRSACNPRTPCRVSFPYHRSLSRRQRPISLELHGLPRPNKFPRIPCAVLRAPTYAHAAALASLTRAVRSLPTRTATTPSPHCPTAALACWRATGISGPHVHLLMFAFDRAFPSTDLRHLRGWRDTSRCCLSENIAIMLRNGGVASVGCTSVNSPGSSRPHACGTRYRSHTGSKKATVWHVCAGGTSRGIEFRRCRAARTARARSGIEHSTGAQSRHGSRCRSLEEFLPLCNLANHIF